MSARAMDMCLDCDRYAVGCSPLVMPDGTRLRQLQRDRSKRYCTFHMPEYRQRKAEEHKRRAAGMPREARPVPQCRMPALPVDFRVISEFDCRDIPAITRSDTPAIYVQNAGAVASLQSKVVEVEWFLLPSPRMFVVNGEKTAVQQSGSFFICGIRGRRAMDDAEVRAVKYRTSQKSDAVWLWREAHRLEEVERWSRKQHHVNVVVWQWGIEATLLQKE